MPGYAAQGEMPSGHEQAHHGQVQSGSDERGNSPGNAEPEREVEYVAEPEQERQPHHHAHDHGNPPKRTVG
jgi:hypothetical protein